MLKLSEMHVGAEVYWTDPDEDFSSGYYTIVSIDADMDDAGNPDRENDEIIVLLKNNEGTEVEVLNTELT